MAFPLVWAEVLATLAVSVLAVFPNTTMTTLEVLGPGAVAPRARRLAVAYIRAHAEVPIPLRGIAEAAGTSSRSLQHAFARHDDASARRWGFAKPGHSARIYRRRSEFLPSHTPAVYRSLR